MIEIWADSCFIVSIDFSAVFGIVAFVLFIPTTPPPNKKLLRWYVKCLLKAEPFFERLLLHVFLRSYVPKKIGMVVFVLFVDYLDTQ